MRELRLKLRTLLQSYKSSFSPLLSHFGPLLYLYALIEEYVCVSVMYVMVVGDDLKCVCVRM